MMIGDEFKKGDQIWLCGARRTQRGKATEQHASDEADYQFGECDVHLGLTQQRLRTYRRA
jgi:hypothetical protein